MMIDIHTHIFPEKIAPRAIRKLSLASHTVPFTDGTERGLLASMERAGISFSVILQIATTPEQVTHINDTAIAINERYAVSADSGAEGGVTPQGDSAAVREAPEKPRLVSLGCMHPAFAAPEEELERIAAAGVKGIKLHPYYHGVEIDDPAYIRILKACASYGLCVVFHTGDDIGFPGMHCATPEMTRRALDKSGAGAFAVCAHMGGWRNWDSVTQYLADSGAFLDTSFSLGRFTPLPEETYYNMEDTKMLDGEAFADIIRRFGTKRILFGSDSPWTDQTASVGAIRELPLTQEEQADILGANAAGLFGLH